MNDLFILARSWKTTCIGIVGGLVLILPNLVDHFRGTPADWDIVMMGLLFMAGMICSKDGNKATEDVELF
jgi:hypothetical protein